MKVLGIHCGIVQHIHASIRAQFLLKLKASLGGSYARFEAMSSLDKSSFVLGNELWEEHFESLLALVKAYIIDIWRNENLSYMVMLSVLNNPVLTLQLGILGKLLGLMGRIVKGCVREVSLAQVSCILMYVYVAPPTPVGAWSMALGLQQRFEYYMMWQVHLHCMFKFRSDSDSGLHIFTAHQFYISSMYYYTVQSCLYKVHRWCCTSLVPRLSLLRAHNFSYDL